MTVLELLVAARERIGDAARWTRRIYARDGRGEAAGPRADDAVCWCAMGALWASWPVTELGDRVLYAAVTRLSSRAWQRGFTGLSDCNDNSSHAAVLSLFDETIAEMQAGGCDTWLAQGEPIGPLS